MNNSNSLTALKMPEAETLEIIDIHNGEPHHHHHITMEGEGDCDVKHSCWRICAKAKGHSGRHYCPTHGEFD